MGELYVDQLKLRVAGISEDESRRLIALVLRGLADTASFEELPRNVDGIACELSARPEEGLESLSARIVVEVLSKLSHSS